MALDPATLKPRIPPETGTETRVPAGTGTETRADRWHIPPEGTSCIGTHRNLLQSLMMTKLLLETKAVPYQSISEKAAQILMEPGISSVAFL